MLIVLLLILVICVAIVANFSRQIGGFSILAALFVSGILTIYTLLVYDLAHINKKMMTGKYKYIKVREIENHSINGVVYQSDTVYRLRVVPIEE